jgi:hypothetical protein
MKMSASNVICFETFRAERNRQGSEGQGVEPAATVTPFRDRLASVLSPRAIAHRRVMLDFAGQLRRRLAWTRTAAATERD